MLFFGFDELQMMLDTHALTLFILALQNLLAPSSKATPCLLCLMHWPSTLLTSLSSTSSSKDSLQLLVVRSDCRWQTLVLAHIQCCPLLHFFLLADSDELKKKLCPLSIINIGEIDERVSVFLFDLSTDRNISSSTHFLFSETIFTLSENRYNPVALHEAR